MNRMLSRIYITIAIFFFVCGFVSAQTITILVPQSTSSIPFFDLERHDAYADVVPGVDVSVEVFANHAQALARLLNGDVELLFTGSSVGWANHLGGGPIVIAGTGIWGVSSIVGTDQEYSSLADLKGKKLALPFPGAPLDIQVRYILESEGVDPDRDMQIVYVPFPQAAAQLASGQLDAAPLPEPLATVLVKGRGLKRYVRLQDAWAEASGGDPYSPQVSLFSTGSVAAATLNSILSAWKAASERITGDPEAAAVSYSEKLGQPEAIVAEAIRNTIFFVPDPAENKKRVLSYMRTLGDGALPSDDFFLMP